VVASILDYPTIGYGGDLMNTHKKDAIVIACS